MPSEKKKIPKEHDDFATRITSGVGSIKSLYIHTFFFIIVFLLPIFGANLDTTLLVLTTVVSLEAIYLSILIQLTVNRNTQSLEVVEENIDEIQADVGEIQEDVDEIQKDVDEIEKDVDEIQKDVDEIEEDVDEIQAADKEEFQHDKSTRDTLASIEKKIQDLMEDIDALKNLKK